jgi:hypothetical protein
MAENYEVSLSYSPSINIDEDTSSEEVGTTGVTVTKVTSTDRVSLSITQNRYGVMDDEAEKDSFDLRVGGEKAISESLTAGAAIEYNQASWNKKENISSWNIMSYGIETFAAVAVDKELEVGGFLDYSLSPKTNNDTKGSSEADLSTLGIFATYLPQ